MKILIVGRTSSGKDSLQDLLVKNYGWSFVKSMTTRPKRHPDEHGHIFISKEEAAAIPQHEKAAWTVINGYEYFCTRQQIYESDAYIVDPKGVEVLLKNMPEEWFRVVYMIPDNPETQREMAIRRAANPEQEAKIFEQRAADEDAQFTAFEQSMAKGTFGAPNCNMFLRFINTYKEQDLENLAIRLELDRRFDRNLQAIIQNLMDHNILNHTENGEVIVFTGDRQPRAVRVPLLVEQLMAKPELLGQMMTHWLQLPGTDVPAFLHPDEQQAAVETTDEGEPIPDE